MFICVQHFAGHINSLKRKLRVGKCDLAIARIEDETLSWLKSVIRKLCCVKAEEPPILSAVCTVVVIREPEELLSRDIVFVKNLKRDVTRSVNIRALRNEGLDVYAS